MSRFKKRRRNPFKNLIKIPKSKNKPDYVLVGTIFAILVFGLVMLSSASTVKSFKEFGDAYYYFKHQLLNGIIPGLIIFYFLSKIDYRRWEKYTIWFFGVSILLLLMVFIPGIGASYGTAKSWINLAGFSVQPSEIAKLFLVLTLAGWFSYRGESKTKDFYNGLIPFAFILGIISILVLLQPDLGTLVVIVTTAMSVYFIAGAKFTHIAGLVLAGIGAFGIMIAQAPYRAARLMTFLHPEIDPQGIGYHINQAFLAVGSGGWLGLGFGQSRQKFAYLPEVMGDSIFAVIAEELGFIFAGGLIILFIFLAFRLLRLSQLINDNYARYIIVGITAWFSFQAFYNIGAMIGLLPLTGIPLPFISYGGTSLVASLAAAGILANISRNVST